MHCLQAKTLVLAFIDLAHILIAIVNNIDGETHTHTHKHVMVPKSTATTITKSLNLLSLNLIF